MECRLTAVDLPHLAGETERRRRGLPRWDHAVVLAHDGADATVLDSLHPGEIGRPLKDLRRPAERWSLDDNNLAACERQIIDVLARFSLDVVPVRRGRFLIDLGGTRRLFGRPLDTALLILRELNRFTGCLSRAGIAGSRLCALLAVSAVPPGTAFTVPAGSDSLFLAGMPAAAVEGLSPRCRRELGELYNLRFLRDLAPFTRDDLRALFGPQDGMRLWQARQNHSPRRLVPVNLEAVIGGEVDLTDAAHDNALVRRRFHDLISDLCGQLRRRNRAAGRARLTLTYRDGYRVERHRPLNALFLERPLYRALRPDIMNALTRRVHPKRVGVTLSCLSEAVLQTSLYEDLTLDWRLTAVCDRLRRRYGRHIVRYAVS